MLELCFPDRACFECDLLLIMNSVDHDRIAAHLVRAGQEKAAREIVLFAVVSRRHLLLVVSAKGYWQSKQARSILSEEPRSCTRSSACAAELRLVVFVGRLDGCGFRGYEGPLCPLSVVVWAKTTACALPPPDPSCCRLFKRRSARYMLNSGRTRRRSLLAPDRLDPPRPSSVVSDTQPSRLARPSDRQTDCHA